MSALSPGESAHTYAETLVLTDDCCTEIERFRLTIHYIYSPEQPGEYTRDPDVFECDGGYLVFAGVYWAGSMAGLIRCDHYAYAYVAKWARKSFAGNVKFLAGEAVRQRAEGEVKVAGSTRRIAA